jgi:hypothetical protein
MAASAVQHRGLRYRKSGDPFGPGERIGRVVPHFRAEWIVLAG